MPKGLCYVENYIDELFEKQIFDFMANQKIGINELKEKHFGYSINYDNKSFQLLLNDNADNSIPFIFEELFNRMLENKLIETKPDQMTVNIHEPGESLEDCNGSFAFLDEFIIYLNLMSNATIEFYQKNKKLMFKIHLKPKSLLILRDESHNEWIHSISNRKHDLLVDSNGNTIVSKRERRVSFTFRKINPNYVDQKLAEPQMDLPTNDLEARLFEKSYVHTIYNEIADHFSQTRHTAWPGVVKFIQSMDPNSWMCDIGCGNGKYLNQRKDLYCVRNCCFE